MGKAGGSSPSEVLEGGGLGLGLLQKTVPLTEAAVSAYAFLATVVKEFGELDACAGLLHLSLRAAPHNHS